MTELTKNIILCADGTGNRGGETPDTNVYRMYHAVDVHAPGRKRQQITFYDNGVGTSTNKYIRAITGALGFGFAENVRGLYEFLARHYSPGDLVYLFGFSRGAATVRAFGGMLQECGLVDRTHPDCQTDDRLDQDKLGTLVKDAFAHYKNEDGARFRAKPYVIDPVRIKFMGIWDTVSALGFPSHTGDSMVEAVLERPLPVWLALAGDRLLNVGPLAHRFYNYEPNEIVDHVYHAVAIDDERKSFLPTVWDERGRQGRVTQVWFAGVHSDVGGSYNQTGLAYETMVWMMERAEHHGLDFVRGALQNAKDKANAHGRLHDSRDGLALYYRYAPRNIENLSTAAENGRPSKLDGRIKIHHSVIERMERSTDRYAPGLLPKDFEVVDTPILNKNTTSLVSSDSNSSSPVDPHVVDPARTVTSSPGATDWAPDRTAVETIVKQRRRLYRVFADFSFLILAAAVWLWNGGTVALPFDDSKLWTLGRETIPWLDGEVFRYFLPAMFDSLIQEIIVDRPTIVVVVLIGFIGLSVIRTRMKRTTLDRSAAVRDKIITAGAPLGDPTPPATVTQP